MPDALDRDSYSAIIEETKERSAYRQAIRSRQKLEGERVLYKINDMHEALWKNKALRFGSAGEANLRNGVSGVTEPATVADNLLQIFHE